MTTLRSNTSSALAKSRSRTIAAKFLSVLFVKQWNNVLLFIRRAVTNTRKFTRTMRQSGVDAKDVRSETVQWTRSKAD